MKKLFICLLFLFGPWLYAQDPFYFRIDKAKGLPSNAVYDIFQDSKGFIWITGGQGLCRYDGKRFVNYVSDKQTLKSGANIQEDPLGRIWYVNFDGYIYYVEGDSLRSFKQAAVWGFLRFGIVGHSLFCVEPGGICQYDLKSLKPLRFFKVNTSLITATTSTKDAFYVLTDKLLVFSQNAETSAIALPSGLLLHMQAPIMTANEQQLVIASKYAPDYLVVKGGRVMHRQFSAASSFLQNLKLSNNEIWFLTTNGMFCVDGECRTSCFQSINTTTILRDRDGAYWVGTMRDGLWHIPGMRDIFFPFHEEIKVVANTRNELIAGSANDALYLLNPSDYSTRPIWKGNSNHEVYLLYPDTLSHRILFSSNSFKCLDLSGRLLSDRAMSVKDVVRISSSTYALAASGLCAIYRPGSRSELTELQTLINNVRGKSIAQIPGTSALLMATNTGLWMTLAGKKRELKSALGESLFYSQLLSFKNCVLAINSSGKMLAIDGKLHVTPVVFKGLYAGETLRRIKLLNDRLYGFAGNSLYRFSPDLKLVECMFSLNNEVELNDVVLWKGKLVIASSKGFIFLSACSQSKQYPPKLVINSVRSGAGLHTSAPFRMQSDDRQVSIDYSILSFDPNVRTSLHYRVNDGSWQVIDDDRHLLELNNLAYGDYRLQLKCGNGTHFSPMQVRYFSVAYPFWMQWWFLVLLFLFILLLIFRFDRWRTMRINRRSAEIIERINLEKKANLSKLKAIKSQMNPHFFFNALNTIQSFILENDKHRAISFLNKFSGLTRSILEMSDKDEVSVAEEIRVLSLYLDIEKVRFDDDFEYEITTSGFDPELVRIPSLLLQPYVENAVKHGLLHKEGHKVLMLSFVKELHSLRIMIIDNGVGRKRSAELNAIKQRRHKSFATDATEQRVSLINQIAGQKISIEYIDELHDTGHAAGTTVIIIIPLH